MLSELAPDMAPPSDMATRVSGSSLPMLVDIPDPIALAQVRERAWQHLTDRLPELTDIVLTSLRTCEPAYRGGLIPPEEPPVSIRKSLAQAFETARTRPEDRADTCDWPREVGRRRAQQGVPLDTVLRTYHTGGQVVCRALMQWAAAEGLPSSFSAALIDEVWDITDLHSSAAATAFHAAESEAPGGQANRASRAASLLDALFGGETDPDFVASAARACALPAHGRYAVVVRRPANGSAPLDKLELPARVAGIRMIWRMHGEVAIGVAALGDTSASALAAALPARPGRRTGVSLAVGGLAELGRARRLAELAAHTVTPDGGTACLEQRLPAALLAARPDLANELTKRILGPVLTLDKISRDLLLETFGAWLKAGGSAAGAASALFCHRNTVLNRLRRFERLTRRSLSAPSDIVELSLALEAFRIRVTRA